MSAKKVICVIFYAIYARPADFPRSFVVRRWRVTKTQQHMMDLSSPFAIRPTLEAARAALPTGLINVGREDDDDSHIVESWV